MFDQNDGLLKSKFNFLHVILSSSQIYTLHPNLKLNEQKSDLLQLFMYTKSGKFQQKSHVTVLYLVTYWPKMDEFENKIDHNFLDFKPIYCKFG